MSYDSEHSVSMERLAGRYRYLEREGLLPLPVKDGVTLVVELRHAEWAGECLNLLQQHSGTSVNLIGVVMNKDFPLAPLAEAFSGVVFIPYASGDSGVNEALAYAATSFVALLEDSVMVSPGWIGNLLWPYIDDPAAQVIAPRSSTEPGLAREQLHFGTEQELAAYVSHELDKRQGEWQETQVLMGSCLVFTRELLLRIGGFDHTLVKRQLMVADWCLRARQLGARLALNGAVYVHVLQPLMEAAAHGAHDRMQEGKLAYLAKWGLGDCTVDVEAGLLPLPADLPVLLPRPAIPLGKRTVAPVPLVTAVVYSEDVLTPAESREARKRLQRQQSYSNIRWIWVRDSRSGAFPELPAGEREAVIAVQGEEAWLYALENVPALYSSENVVYLSASADYDGQYVERIAEALRHGSADLVVSPASSDAEALPRLGAYPGGPLLELPLERIAHRSGIIPGRITMRNSSGCSLQLEPEPSLTIGYIGGPPEASISIRHSDGEARL